MAGTQPNQKFTLKEKGVPSLRGGSTGDQVTTVEIVIPKSINEAQRKALLEFVKASGGSIAPQEKGFFERLKEKLS